MQGKAKPFVKKDKTPSATKLVITEKDFETAKNSEEIEVIFNKKYARMRADDEHMDVWTRLEYEDYKRKTRKVRIEMI